MASNTYKLGPRERKPAVLGETVIDPAAWRAEDVQNLEFVYQLDDAEKAEILDAVAGVQKAGIELKDIRREHFPLPRFAKVMEKIVRDEVADGRGFIFLRGLPVADEVLPNAIAQWGLATYIGEAQPQNKSGHLLEHVKNAGGDINTPTGRGYNSPSALGFHSDSADGFSLMCLRGGKSGGEHRIVSSVSVYNEMLKRRPDLAKELEFHFYRSRRGEIPAGEVNYHRQPVFSVTDGYFSARGASSTIRRAQKLPGVPKLTDIQREAIGFYQSLASELSLFIDWHPGDVSFVQNHVALHARTAYEDWPEADRKRHLLRLWLRMDARPVHKSIAEDMSGIKLPEGTTLKTPLDMTPVAA